MHRGAGIGYCTSTAFAPRQRSKPPLRNFPSLLVLLLLPAVTACSPYPVSEDHAIAGLRHFEMRRPEPGIAGIIIGAAFGLAEPEAAELATVLSDETVALLAARTAAP